MNMRGVMELCIALLFFGVVQAVLSNGEGLCNNKKSDYVSVLHMYGPCSPVSKPHVGSWASIVLTMASNDPKRAQFLSSLVSGAPVASGQQVLNIGNYLVRAQVGSPGQLLFMVLDTSYSSAWVPCSGPFYPNASSTFVPLDCSSPQCAMTRGLPCPGPCTFSQSYGDDSSLTATLSQDSLTLGTTVLPNYTFGCIASVTGKSIPPQGLLGLGRGPLSLLSQSTSGVFSYCLPSFKSYYFSGSLKLGPAGQPRSIKTTPLILNPHRPSLYFVNLTGVSVGRVHVDLSLTLDPATCEGTIIDSGTVITRLVEPVYTAIRDEYRRQVGNATVFTSLGTLDTCFPVTHENVAPSLTLHFTGLNLTLPMENTLIHSSSGSLACLAMSTNVNSDMNIIGNLQQQNLRIMFDVPNSRLGIAREVCN